MSGWNFASFIHHEWFVEHHLQIVESLANELCDLYPNADRHIVFAMVWLHDFCKILTRKTLPREAEDQLTFLESQILMQDLGFPVEFSSTVVENLKIF